MMVRGESFRSDTRVPTHMANRMSNGQSLDRVVQSAGRASFLTTIPKGQKRDEATENGPPVRQAALKGSLAPTPLLAPWAAALRFWGGCELSHQPVILGFTHRNNVDGRFS